jgi:excisionase family DNA binding protein
MTELRDLDFMSVREVAERLKVSRMTVHRIIKSGELPAYQIGRLFRISKTDVETYLRHSMVYTPPKTHFPDEYA